MAAHDPQPDERPEWVVGIGASAGGYEPLTQLVTALPADLPAAVLVVVHLGASTEPLLPRLLDRSAALRVVAPTGDQPLTRGCVYVAPPDRHLVVQGDRVRVVRGPKENGHRPAVDPLFRSMARAAGSRSVGIVLSGALSDGAAGLRAVHQAGGRAAVQDPGEARVASMPREALLSVPGAAVCPSVRWPGGSRSR